MAFAPVKNQPAYLQVFEAIEAAILAGELEEGAALPTEQSLCEQFGVQRSTVREGIRLLEQTGLVRRINARRLVVMRPQPAESAEYTRRGLERQGVTFTEIHDAIAAIQPATARLAAVHASPADLAELDGITADLKCATTTEAVVEGGERYLFAVGRATGNPVIEVMLRSLNLLGHTTMGALIEQLPDAQQRIIDAQAAITRALRAADPDDAEAWMRRHVDDLRRGYELAGLATEAD
ncbi:MAG: GntR family transcriptional regulator [Pseudomonadota bacterium]